jgi:anti-sigma factor RsiW
VSDHRELEQDLVEMALGEVAEPRRSELLSHLTGCLRCRATYSDVVAAIDATITAAPEAQPPAGFEARVLASLGIESAAQTGPVERLTRSRTSRLLLAAAAVVVAVAAGALGASALQDGDPGDPGDPGDTAAAVAPGLPEATTVLHTGDGEDVGTASVAWMHERRVLVVSVHTAPVGVAYSCRVKLSEGDSRVLGRWEASSTDGGVWVMPAPQGDLNALELVTDSGEVWSSARLP